jgi:hypothetical protein
MLPASTCAKFEAETAAQLALLGTPNQIEAATAMMRKRAATFSDAD